jgi:RNA polymerase sigma factor (sigma-70 family)
MEPAAVLSSVDRTGQGADGSCVASADKWGIPMCDSGNTEDLVRRMNDGDDDARDKLIAHVNKRLLKLTEVMMRNYPSLWKVEQPDDVWQEASLRLIKALKSVTPTSALHFMNLATLQISRELRELARHYRGRCGQKPIELTNQQANPDREGPLENLADPTREPLSLEGWADFHAFVEELPDKEREVFRLRYYYGAKRDEIAETLGIDPKSVDRRWQRALRFLYERIGDDGLTD